MLQVPRRRRAAAPLHSGVCRAQGRQLCQAHTIRMAMEQREVYENCEGGAKAICCEPRFLTEANNADEVHHGYVLALENVLKNRTSASGVTLTRTPSRSVVSSTMQPSARSPCRAP